MKSGKKVLGVIILLLVLLLMAGGAFAYVYLATDILKTDKELFLIYFSQIASSEEGFIEKGIKDFYEKKSQTPYENSGKITVEAEAPEGISENIIDKVNDLSIKYTGKVDSTNQKVDQSIEVDYGNDVIFPVRYRQDGNKIGLQFGELSKQFISVRNENLKEFAQKFGIEDVSEIPNEIDFSEKKQEIQVSDQEKEQLKQIYGTVLQQELVDENFTSLKTEQNESYTLELSNEQVKNIIIKMLEATKQNTLIIDKINEIMLEQDSEAEKIEVSDIDDLIESINEENIEDIPNLKLTLVQSDKKLNQIIIQVDESQITINKVKGQDNLSYEINCGMKASEKQEDTDSVTSVGPDSSIIDTTDSIMESVQANLYFKVQYTGLDSLSNVQENYGLGFDIEAGDVSMAYDYKINANTQFNDSVSIESLDNTVAVFLNDHNEEQVTNFLTQVGTRLLDINKKQMEKLGLKEYENPVLYSNPVTSVGIMLYNMYTMVNESITDTSVSDYEIQAFNTQFINYEGEDRSGSEVNAMIATIQNSNLSSELEDGKFVKVILDGIETTEKVDSSKTYTIEAVYDDDGYVSEMKVTTK